MALFQQSIVEVINNNNKMFDIVKYLLSGYLGADTFIIPLDTNFLSLASPRAIVSVSGKNNLAISIIPVNKCIM